MKTPKSIPAFVAALFLAATTSAFAQSTWQTVDDYQFAPGVASVNRCIAAAPNGTIFVSGGGSGRGLVHRSLDAGATWEVVLEVTSANFIAITVAPSGSVIAAGPTVKKWIAYRSADNGATWTMVDSVSSPTMATAWGAGADAAGRIYVCGDVSEGNGYTHWQVRRSVDDGLTWTTADDFRAPGATVARSIAFTPSSIVVAGSMSGVWAVRRSSNGGNTWTTAEKFQLNSRYTSHGNGVTANANGHFFVTGYASTATESRFVTRRSLNGGLTWQTVDNVAGAGIGRGITVDAFGRIFAVGGLGSNPQRWSTRASLDGGATWFTSDTFALASPSSIAWSVAGDALGNVFVCGDSFGADGPNHGVVRKLPAP